MTNALLTVTEVAARLKCHPHTVRRWIWARRLRAVKVGDLVRVSEQEVTKFIKPNGIKKPGKKQPRAEKGARGLIAAMRRLRGRVPAKDVQQMEGMIADAQIAANWSNPLG